MHCFTRFINNTASPVITVLVDDSRIFSDVLQNTTTPYAALNVGTREITVLQNNDKVYLKACVSLPPLNHCTILIEDNNTTLISD